MFPALAPAKRPRQHRSDISIILGFCSVQDGLQLRRKQIFERSNKKYLVLGSERVDPGGEQRLSLHTARKTSSGPERVAARSLVEPAGGCLFEGQTDPTSNDLQGAASGIFLTVPRIKRPRQNSHDRASIHPGSALSIVSARSSWPSVCSNRRTSSKFARLIACAMIRAGERGSEPTCSHQKYVLSSSDNSSLGKPLVRDFSITSCTTNAQRRRDRGTDRSGCRHTERSGNHTTGFTPGSAVTRSRNLAPRISKLRYWSNDAQAGDSSTTGSASPDASASCAA
jgi:hypothetical protein